jgi:hypothetical protein
LHCELFTGADLLLPISVSGISSFSYGQPADAYFSFYQTFDNVI